MVLTGTYIPGIDNNLSLDFIKITCLELYKMNIQNKTNVVVTFINIFLQWQDIQKKNENDLKKKDIQKLESTRKNGATSYRTDR